MINDSELKKIFSQNCNGKYSDGYQYLLKNNIDIFNKKSKYTFKEILENYSTEMFHTNWIIESFNNNINVLKDIKDANISQYEKINLLYSIYDYIYLINDFEYSEQYTVEEQYKNEMSEFIQYNYTDFKNLLLSFNFTENNEDFKLFLEFINDACSEYNNKNIGDILFQIIPNSLLQHFNNKSVQIELNAKSKIEDIFYIGVIDNIKLNIEKILKLSYLPTDEINNWIKSFNQIYQKDKGVNIESNIYTNEKNQKFINLDVFKNEEFNTYDKMKYKESLSDFINKVIKEYNVLTTEENKYAEVTSYILNKEINSINNNTKKTKI